MCHPAQRLGCYIYIFHRADFFIREKLAIFLKSIISTYLLTYMQHYQNGTTSKLNKLLKNTGFQNV